MSNKEEEKSSGEITEFLSAIKRQVGTVNNKLDSLEERLNPVLSSSPDEKGDEDATAPETTLGEALQNILFRLQSVSDRIHVIEERVKI